MVWADYIYYMLDCSYNNYIIYRSNRRNKIWFIGICSNANRIIVSNRMRIFTITIRMVVILSRIVDIVVVDIVVVVVDIVVEVAEIVVEVVADIGVEVVADIGAVVVADIGAVVAVAAYKVEVEAYKAFP
jgi:hypothetical protein